MPSIVVKPFVLSDVDLTLGDAGYEAHVSTAQFVPTTPMVVWKGLTPTATFTDVGAASWALNLSYAQDWATSDSLSQYLFDNQGQTVTCVFAPSAGGSSFTADIVILPGSIGGAVDTTAVATVALGVSGQVTRVVVV